MKRLFFIAAIIASLTLQFSTLQAQSCYWVFLTDKAGTSFDPYTYFDSKAIERYRLNNADLYDFTNYPLNNSYVRQIDAVVTDLQSGTEIFGQSRWLNAVAVTATAEQIAAIERLPFVREVALLGDDMLAASVDSQTITNSETIQNSPSITDQLLRMQGELFVGNGIDGTGIRIAVFDGGFHAVNTHLAFKHLRDEGRIIATWDFTRKQEDVYDNHGHGTMVLSCIAGRMGDKLLGLATGATFLLAKTEVDPEPYKEEVWWAQAVEWADKNGADIINSSLGYTSDRHYTWQMDGRSYVSKAANIAARKGILVCNSAGNSGEDSNWKIIGTPADADSIISVGGIEHSLTSYKHISFSSYGPTADGRLKPNVCAFGIAEVAKPYNDTLTEFNAGTSFSCPLVTGFAACAMQAVRDEKPTAMQMKQMIEESADLYPYYDYALGYGVPQADYFTDFAARNIYPARTFLFEERGDYVLIRPKHIMPSKQTADNDNSTKAVMFKIQDDEGHIERYVNLGIKNIDSNISIAIPKAAIHGYTLVANVDGFTNTFRLSNRDKIIYKDKDHTFEYYLVDTTGYIHDNYAENTNRTLADNNVSNWGVGQRHLLETHVQLGALWTFGNDAINYGLGARAGLRYLFSLKKWYGIGLGLDMDVQELVYPEDALNPWDNSLALQANANIDGKYFDLGTINLELFQRIRFKKGGSFRHKGLHWDMGIYGGLQYNSYTVSYNADQNANSSAQTNIYYNVKPAADSKLQWGLATRLVWDWIGLYGRLRMSQTDLDLPRFEIGLQLSL